MAVSCDVLTVAQLVRVSNGYSTKQVNHFSSRAAGARHVEAELKTMAVDIEEAFDWTFPRL